MTGIVVYMLDERAMRAYSRGVNGGDDTQAQSASPFTGKPRRRRRSPSPSEAARRTARIIPWADTWKELKRAGRWR